jgi:hypothetical protein
MGVACGCVREPGSRTLPFSAGFPPLQVPLANGQNMHAGSCQPILVGCVREPGSRTYLTRIRPPVD